MSTYINCLSIEIQLGEGKHKYEGVWWKEMSMGVMRKWGEWRDLSHKERPGA